jgi:predicted dehydrogenase
VAIPGQLWTLSRQRIFSHNRLVVAILGSGFGLYGYLPALAGGCGQEVVLPERYRQRFAARAELAPFARSIHWETDESKALDCATQVVVALRPVDQGKWIPSLLERSNIQGLVLEKPLAPSPESATGFLDKLLESKKVIRIGYTFKYTSWADRLRSCLAEVKESSRLTIEWKFLAHHFQYDLNNWKRFSDSGGGALRFYGIQVIALLADVGYSEVSSSRSIGLSPNQIEKWSACLTGPGLPDCNVLVDTKAARESFRVELRAARGDEGDVVVADLLEPFGSAGRTAQTGGLDSRIPALTSLCRALWQNTGDEYRSYEAAIRLWSIIEKKGEFQAAGSSKS